MSEKGDVVFCDASMDTTIAYKTTYGTVGLFNSCYNRCVCDLRKNQRLWQEDFSWWVIFSTATEDAIEMMAGEHDLYAVVASG
ncbi:MAG: hypothetical protein ACI97A_000807 [Planctomycetota bacterium]|jgi:hypothetical protein